MSHSFDLERIEKESRSVINQDGLTFLFMGILILFLGVSFSEAQVSWLGLLGILLIFPLEMVRRRITYPRIGYVKFETTRAMIAGILVFCLIVMVALFLLIFAFDGRFQSYLPFAISLVFALSLYFGASTYGIRLIDWLIMALILGLGLFTTWRYDSWKEGTSVLLIISGIIVIVIGTVQLLLFLRKHPLPQQNEDHS